MGQVMLSVFVLKSETTRVKTENVIKNRETFSDNVNRRSRPREENSYNNRYNNNNQQNNISRAYSPYPLFYRTDNFERSRCQTFGSLDRSFNNRINSQNNDNRHSLYNTNSNNNNQKKQTHFYFQ